MREMKQYLVIFETDKGMFATTASTRMVAEIKFMKAHPGVVVHKMTLHEDDIVNISK